MAVYGERKKYNLKGLVDHASLNIVGCGSSFPFPVEVRMCRAIGVRPIHNDSSDGRW